MRIPVDPMIIQPRVLNSFFVKVLNLECLRFYFNIIVDFVAQITVSPFTLAITTSSPRSEYKKKTKNLIIRGVTFLTSSYLANTDFN